MNDAAEKLEQELIKYFRQGIKKDSKTFCMGLELEHILVDGTSGKAVDYYGENGVEQILEELSPYYKKKIYSENHLVGLGQEEFILTLEPAAQLEISIYPQSEINHIAEIYSEFRKSIEPVLRKYGYLLAQVGYQPCNKAEELSLIPKERYKMMDFYFEKIGKYGQEMMRGTASTQVAIDYYSEEDFMVKYKVANLLAPIVQFLFEHTPFYEGRENKEPMIREKIWKNVDRERVDVWKQQNSLDMDFQSYAKFVLDVPMIVKQTESGVEYSEETAREIYKSKKELAKIEIEHILSMVFPMVRLKNYIEIRYADSMPIKQAMSYVVFMKGLFVGIEETNAYFESLHVNHIAMVESAYMMLRMYGKNAVIYGKAFGEIVKDLYEIVKRHVREEELAWIGNSKSVYEFL